MSDFVVDFNLLGGIKLDESWNETDRMEEGGKKKKRRHAEINERDAEELEKSRNVAGTLWSVRYSQTSCAKKDLAVDFKSITKMELNQSLSQIYATVENGKGEPYGSAGVRERLNGYVNDPPISRNCCLMKDPVFTAFC